VFLNLSQAQEFFGFVLSDSEQMVCACADFRLQAPGICFMMANKRRILAKRPDYTPEQPLSAEQLADRHAARFALPSTPGLRYAYSEALERCKLGRDGRPPKAEFVQELVQAWKQLMEAAKEGEVARLDACQTDARANNSNVGSGIGTAAVNVCPECVSGTGPIRADPVQKVALVRHMLGKYLICNAVYRFLILIVLRPTHVKIPAQSLLELVQYRF
jgi:hypothetical protein